MGVIAEAILNQSPVAPDSYPSRGAVFSRIKRFPLVHACSLSCLEHPEDCKSNSQLYMRAKSIRAVRLRHELLGCSVVYLTPEKICSTKCVVHFVVLPGLFPY